MDPKETWDEQRECERVRTEIATAVAAWPAGESLWGLVRVLREAFQHVRALETKRLAKGGEPIEAIKTFVAAGGTRVDAKKAAGWTPNGEPGPSPQSLTELIRAYARHDAAEFIREYPAFDDLDLADLIGAHKPAWLRIQWEFRLNEASIPESEREACFADYKREFERRLQLVASERRGKG
jgi:hypothetical protein